MSDPSDDQSPPTDNPGRAGTAPFDATSVAPQPDPAGAPDAVQQAVDAAQAQTAPGAADDADDAGIIGGEATLAATSWGGAPDEEMAPDDQS